MGDIDASPPQDATPQVVEQIACDLTSIEQFLTVHRHLLMNNIWPFLRTFLSWLRCNNVFSLVDQQRIDESPKIRIDKAGDLLDAIVTKGHSGFRLFMQVVEYQCPGVYEHIFKVDARPPSSDFRGSVRKNQKTESRLSHSALWDQLSRHLGELSCRAVADFQTEISRTVQRLQDVDDKNFQDFQDNLDRLQEDNAALRASLKTCELERDEQAGRLRDTKARMDRLTEDNVELAASVADLKTQSLPSRPSSAKRITVGGCTLCDVYKLELEARTTERNEFAVVLQRTKRLHERDSADLKFYWHRCDQLETELQLWLTTQPRDRTRNLKDYECLAERAAARRTPGASHLEDDMLQQFDYVTGEKESVVQTMKGKASSSSVSSSSSSSSSGSTTSSSSSTSSLASLRRSLRLQPKRLTMDKKLLRFTDRDRQRDRLTAVSIDTNALTEDITLVGGNYSGVFIAKCSEKARRAQLREGDQVLKISKYQRDKSMEIWSMENLTKENVDSILRKLSGEITIHKRSNTSDYKLLSEAKSSELVKDDCFCVREWLSIRTTGTLQPAPGDVVMVTDTMHVSVTQGNTKNVWYGMRLDRQTGRPGEAGTLKGNVRSIHAQGVDQSGAEREQNRKAIRGKTCKYVMPYEALYKRPVVVFGSHDLLHALRNTCVGVFVEHNFDDFLTEKDKKFGFKEAQFMIDTIVKYEQHVLLRASLSQTREMLAAEVHPIIVILTDGEQEPEMPSLFGYQTENLRVERTEDLCRRLVSLTTHIQDHVIWLNCAAPMYPLFAHDT